MFLITGADVAPMGNPNRIAECRLDVGPYVITGGADPAERQGRRPDRVFRLFLFGLEGEQSGRLGDSGSERSGLALAEPRHSTLLPDRPHTSIFVKPE